MACNGCDAPILVVLWGPDAQKLDTWFEGRALQTGGCCCAPASGLLAESTCRLTVPELEPQHLVDALNAALKTQSDLQILYVAAHGDCWGLSGSSTHPGVDFYELFPELAEALARHRRLALVFGSCNVFRPDQTSGDFSPENSPLALSLPPAISTVIGFRDPISIDEVAAVLAAAHAAALRRLTERLSGYRRFLSQELAARLQSKYDVIFRVGDKDTA